MKTLFPSAYFGPVEYWAAWIQSEKPVLEIHENYRKRSYRSRACIATGNGILPLNIPVRHTGNASTGRMKMEQAATSVEFRWAREHFRSLETAYRTSPYFEFYEDMFRELYFGDVSSLLDFNIRAHKLVCRLLGDRRPCGDYSRIRRLAGGHRRSAHGIQPQNNPCHTF